MQKITFLMTSDTHGYWLNLPNKPEQSLLNTVATINHIKENADHPVVSIDLGDFIQGSSFATYCSQIAEDGNIFARAVNEIGYDAQIIGNHEFNFGAEYRQTILEQVKAPILCCNIVDAETQEPALGEAYKIIEVAGVKIGIIGTTTHYIPNWELPQHYEGLAFKDAFETTQYYVELLRPQVDVLVVAYHGGYEKDLNTWEPLEDLTGENQGARMLQEIPEIDVLLTGHQHRLINQQVNKTWTVQPGYAGERVATVTVSVENGEILELTGELHDTSKYEAETNFKAVIEPERTQGEAWLNHVLGEATLDVPTTSVFEARLNGIPFVELLNQLQLAETDADFSAVALINDSFSKFTGPVTNEVLLEVYPYYNRIAKVQVTGQDLYEIIEYDLEYLVVNETGEIDVNPEYVHPKPRHYNYDLFSGVTIKADLKQPLGQRIQALINEKTQEPIDRDAIYTLAVSQYRAVGGGDYKNYTKDKIRFISEIDIATRLREALANYTPEQWAFINENYIHVEWL